MTYKTYSLVLIPLLMGALISIDSPPKKMEPAQIRRTAAFTGSCGGNLDQVFRQLDSVDSRAPLFDKMGNHSYNIHTISPEAQKYFDQGLKLIYGFNHGEAGRSFKEALKLDPYCAMAHWGIAMALGPNINDWIPSPEREQEAYEILRKGQMIASGSEKESDLIAALMQRHSDSSKVDRDSLNDLYMLAMKQLALKYADDREIQTLYADAIMNTMPWDYYEKNLEAKPLTQIAVDLLEGVIAKNDHHPGAHHFYIHIVEASANPDRGISSADKLGNLVPAAGHLVHMPAHIYARVGDYEAAAESNRKAILADENYLASCQAEGIYPLGYYPHNIHFLWLAATMSGQREEALDAAEKVADKIPGAVAGDDPSVQNFLVVPLKAYLRFGLWNEILTTPKPDSEQSITNMFWRHARSVAFSKKGLLRKAQIEIDSLLILIVTHKQESVPDSIDKGETQDSAYDMFEDLYQLLTLIPEAELEKQRGNYQLVIEKLEIAIEIEDRLPYNEPPNWHHPVRLVLGDFLLSKGNYLEAEKVFRQDLEKNRNNGWALFGLRESLQKTGRSEEAGLIDSAFKKAWIHADFKLDAVVF